MNSRYGSLRTIGTLSIILAWISLILGVIGALAVWFGVGGWLNAIAVLPGWIPLVGAVPALLWGIGGFLWLYATGKVLHLLVDVDERTMGISQGVGKLPTDSPPELEIAGELKRQAKLIASNLESTQALSQQVASLEEKLIATPALVAAQPEPPVVAVDTPEVASEETKPSPAAD